MNVRRRDEQEIQRAIHTWLERTFDCEVVHVPNGGSRNKVEAINFKADGVQAGHPDLIVYAAGGIIRHVEVKTSTGALTASQRHFLPRLEELGFTTIVVRSLDEMKSTAADWGLPPRLRYLPSSLEMASRF